MSDYSAREQSGMYVIYEGREPGVGAISAGEVMRRLQELEAVKAREEAAWWPKPWPQEFDGPVIAFAKSADPLRPLVHQAWWNGERLSLLPVVWIEAVTHIRPMPRPPLAASESPTKEGT